MGLSVDLANGGQLGITVQRQLFWRYCLRAVNGAKARAAKLRVPCQIDAHEIDRLLVDQGWCCAVSYVPLEPPNGKPGPFGPSLDRIVPARGYVTGNVRVVCNLINSAMSNWGEEPLLAMIRSIRGED